MAKFIKKPLSNNHSAQCHVEEYEDGTIVFVSYKTPIAKIDNGLLCPIQSGKFYDGERVYTRTTAKQVGYFLKEYCPDINYPQFKHAALNGEDILLG